MTAKLTKEAAAVVSRYAFDLAGRTAGNQDGRKINIDICPIVG